MIYQILALVLLLALCLMAYMWLRAMAENVRLEEHGDSMFRQTEVMQTLINHLTGENMMLTTLNEKKFPFKTYSNLKLQIFYYLDLMDKATNMDTVQEAECYAESLTEIEKELFEWELEGLEKKVYAAKNKFCSYCGGHGVITSEVEISGRIIDGSSVCKYCNGSGLF